MKKLGILLALALVIGGALPGLAQDMMDYPSDLTACEVDLTGETINIFHFGDLSGPYAFITQPIVSRGDRCGELLEQPRRRLWRGIGADL